MSSHVLGLYHHVVLLLGLSVHVGKGSSDDSCRHKGGCQYRFNEILAAAFGVH